MRVIAYRPVIAVCCTLVLSAAALSGVDAHAQAARHQPAVSSRACPPAATALGYSDALDKRTVDGVTVGGLSSLAWDRRAHAWASAVDNHDSDPSRIWFFRNLAHPRLVGEPLVLRTPDGTPYDGTTADDEGLAVLPDGDYLVSSETEPSIRVFGRDGVQRAELPVPARFAVAPAGEASANATLEGLTISPSGRTVVAAMEGALSGDTNGGADTTLHRFLVYAHRHGRWVLRKQVAYRAEPGQRIPEVAAVDDHRLIVEEASYDPATGNAVSLFETSGLARAEDVSAVSDLAVAPRALELRKRLVANLVECPTLGAPAKETQANPLLDNFEGMAITFRAGRRVVGVSLISDDNFMPTQTTRVLNLVARLPR